MCQLREAFCRQVNPQISHLGGEKGEVTTKGHPHTLVGTAVAKRQPSKTARAH